MAAESRAGLGIPGRLARLFIFAKLTPVLAVASLLLGILAVWQTPKEEEPQISVPMIDIRTGIPGLEAADVERQVTEPIERAVWGLEGVEYVYSSSNPSGSLVTVRFRVGEPLEPSLLKVHDKIQSLRPELPEKAVTPQVRSYTINDVPFLVLTFSSGTRDDFSIRQLVAPLARELASTPDLGRVELLGGLRRVVRVVADPAKMAAHGVSMLAVAQALQVNDAYVPAGKNWSNTKVFDIDIGAKLRSAEDVRGIVVGSRAGGIVHIGDVADVTDGPEERTRISTLVDKNGDARNAVSVVFAKRKGTDVVVLANRLVERADAFAKSLPTDVTFAVERNYGATAGEKTRELIKHLILATLSVAALIAITMGLRSSLVVGIAIPVTLALTLAIYYFLGYTLNRVTLFALIFSIGILVDDAIVVVENTERHLRATPGRSLVDTTIRAVAEIGNPTILATATVIAAILPMAFVRGLMGPYMRPIPIGGSLAMVLSLFVAFTVTPWAAVRLLKAVAHAEHAPGEGRLDRLYRAVMDRLLTKAFASWLFGLAIVVLLLLSCALVAIKAVKVKMLPFDNRDEFQVLIDYPPTTPLMKSAQDSTELARRLLKDPEVKEIQIFAGEPAPFSFAGMVKHTYLRASDWQSDLAIRLTPKDERKIDSHSIIAKLRHEIEEFGAAHQATTRVLEIPPGPPVMATMVAEVYGPTQQIRRAVATQTYETFAREKSVVDLDYSWRPGRPRLVYRFDQPRGGLLGATSDNVTQLGHFIFSETPLVTLEAPTSPEPVTVDLSVLQAARSGAEPLAKEVLPSPEAGVVSLNQVLTGPTQRESVTLFRKNLTPVEYVTSELTGTEEAPVYGILKLGPKLDAPQQTAQVPWDTRTPVIKWDGEWFVTYEVFRDLGLAFAVVMVLIYILVVGWFRSFAVPLVIMAPIPISLIGILPGHAISGAFFTATSMIGFIAGAGVIVRNSIILVDYIEQEVASGLPLKEAVISAGVLRFRPMLLTAAAVVVGSVVILFDPIFQGLAISLMSGEVAATLLSRFAVPVLYYRFVGRRRERHLRPAVESPAGSTPTHP